LNKIRKRILNNPAQRLAPLTAGQVKPAKISFSFNGRAQSRLGGTIKETIFAGFASLLAQGRAASHPQSAFGAEFAKGQKFLSHTCVASLRDLPPDQYEKIKQDVALWYGKGKRQVMPASDLPFFKAYGGLQLVFCLCQDEPIEYCRPAHKALCVG